MFSKKQPHLMNSSQNTDHIDRAKSFTRGGQITFHNLRMLLQINKTVGKIFCWVFVVLLFPMIYFITPRDVILETIAYWYARFLNFMGFNKILLVPYQGQKYPVSTDQIVQLNYFHHISTTFNHYLILSGVLSLIISSIILYFVVRWLTKKGNSQAGVKFMRGIQFASLSSFIKALKRNDLASDIHIDKLPLLKDAEVQHILIHGTTGAGKSQLITKLLCQIRARGQKAIIYDKGCNFVQHFYREGKDHILNPFDKRCANWNVWSEGTDETIFESMSNSLIPMHGESEPFWVNAARTIFSSAAYKMREDADRSNKKLLKLLLTQSLDDMNQYLANTEAASLVDKSIEKTAISIKSVLATYLKSIRFLYSSETTKVPSFSIRQWIQNDKDDSWLFITSNDQQQASLRPLMSMWLALAANFILSLEKSSDRRIWEIMDELPSLHKLPELPETIAEARKYGGCFVLGMQSYAQLQAVYGARAAESMNDLLNTRFFFRSPSSDMAEFSSRQLGKQDVEETRETYSYGANTIRDGVSISVQQTTRFVISESEVMQLPNLTCFVRYPSELPTTKLQLTYTDSLQAISKSFIPRDIYVDEDEEKLIQSLGAFTPNIVKELYADKKEVTALFKTIKSDKSKAKQANPIKTTDHVIQQDDIKNDKASVEPKAIPNIGDLID